MSHHILKWANQKKLKSRKNQFQKTVYSFAGIIILEQVGKAFVRKLHKTLHCSDDTLSCFVMCKQKINIFSKAVGWCKMTQVTWPIFYFKNLFKFLISWTAGPS